MDVRDPGREEEGESYFIPDQQTEILAILLFREHNPHDGDETWVNTDPTTRYYYRCMARGKEPLIEN